MSGAEYRVNKATGQVVKDDGTGWKPVASVRNKTTGEILIDEGNGWQPMPGSQRVVTPDPAMTNASLRANAARASGQRIAQDDLTQLGKLDLSTAAMARLPAPTMTTQQLDAFDAQRAAEKERFRVPDSDLKERLVIGSNVGTFGHGPQAMAGASTLGALLATPFVEGDIIDREGVSGAMSSFLDEARVHQRRGREERPIESYGGEIVGSLLQGKTLIDNIGRKVLPKTNTVSNVARVMGTGLGYGSLYGFGQSESDTIEGALGDAAFGGAVGAGTGLVFKAAEPAITAGYRAGKTGVATLSDALSAAIGKAGTARDRVAEDVAIAAVRRSMQRSGMTFDEIMEQVKRYEGKPAVLAEVIGQDAVNALTALTRRPGATPQKAQAIIEERTFARPERMRGDVEDATGIPIGQLDETLGKQLEERQAAAKPLYDALYKRFSTIESFRQPGQTGQVMKRINRLARTPLAQRHLQLAKDAVATIAARRGIAVSKMSKMEYWDLVKRSLDDAIDSAKAKGEARTRVGEGIEDLVGLKNDLVDELDRLTGGAYAAAREVGGEAPRLKAAAVAGQKAMQARNPREVAKTVAATLSQDLPALRAGVVDDLGTRIDKGMLPSRVRVPDVAGKLRASLGEESANKLINKFDAEAALAETGSRWAPRLNSVTGTVMESGATAMGDDLINAGFNLATGNKVGLLRQAINFMRQRGFSQRQIDAIGDLLLSSPEEGLKRLRVMAPDGVPAGAAAPLAGGGGGGDLPPGGGAPVPTPTPASPIRAGGFAGFGGRPSNAFDPETPLFRGTDDAAGNLDGLQNPDGWHGAGIYLTTSTADAAKYSTRGAGKRAELMDDQIALAERAGDQEAVARLTAQRDRMAQQGTPTVSELRARMKNPVTLDNDGGTVWQPAEANRLIDALVSEIDDAGITYGAFIGQKLRAQLQKDGRLTASDFERIVRAEADADFIRAETSPGQVISQAYQALGHDGVVMKNAADVLPKGSTPKGTTHVTVFDKTLLSPPGTKSSGLPGLRTDLGAGAVGALFSGAMPMEEDATLEDKLARAGTGFLLGYGASKGGRVGARMLANAKAAPKAKVGKPKRDLGTKAADAAAIASLTFTPPAQAQGSDGSAELEAAKQRVTDIQTRAIPELEDQLRVLRDPKGDPFAKQEILKLRGYPLGTTGPRGDGVDGVIGQRTTQAIVDEAKKIERDIEKRRKDLEQARAGVTQLEMRMAQQEAEVGPITKTLREAAPWAGTIAGLAIAGISRRGAVVKSRAAAREAADRANALLNANPKVSRSQRGADSISTRASNLNEFWRLGGAGDNVPFKKTKEGKWTQRPKPMEPSRLFPPERNPIRSMDAGVMVGGLAEAGGSQMMIMDNQKKAAEARANIEKYAAKGDLAGVKRAQAQLEEAENMVALATAARNLGLGIAGGRGIAALKMPYAPIRPHINMAAAEDEQALLLSKMKK